MAWWLSFKCLQLKKKASIYEQHFLATCRTTNVALHVVIACFKYYHRRAQQTLQKVDTTCKLVARRGGNTGNKIIATYNATSLPRRVARKCNLSVKKGSTNSQAIIIQGTI